MSQVYLFHLLALKLGLKLGWKDSGFLPLNCEKGLFISVSWARLVVWLPFTPVKMECFRLVRLISPEELCLNRASPLCFPQTCQRYCSLLHSEHPGRGSVCSFVRNRENWLTNLRRSPKLHKWKPVTTNIMFVVTCYLFPFATDPFPEAWLKWRVVSAVHVHSGWDGKP